MMKLRGVVGAVGIALLCSSALAQITANGSFEFRSGRQGLAHTLTLKIELIGGDRGDRVLATTEIDPPVPDGFPHGEVRTVPVRFNRAVNLRLVRFARLSVRGDRPGQDITTGWSLEGLRFINADRNVFWTMGRVDGVVINAERPSWNTPGWDTYDPAGMKWKLPSLDLVVRTGADDLRDDAFAGAMVWYQDGSTSTADLSQGKGIGRSQSKVATIRNRSLQSLDDVQGVFLFHMGYQFLTGATQRKLADIQGYTNSDTWTVGKVEMRANLPDGAKPVRAYDQLERNYNGTVLGQTSTRAIVPKAPVASYAGVEFRLAIFFDSAAYDLRDLNDLPEIAAYVRLRGETNYRLFTGRQDRSQKYSDLPSRASIWSGPATVIDFSGNRSTKLHFTFEQKRNLWRDYPTAPIEEVQLRLMSAPRADGMWTNTLYGGGRTVRLRGMMFGYKTGGSDTDLIGMNTLSQYVILGAQFHDTIELSRSRQTTSYRVNHVLPELPSKTGAKTGGG